jgi:prepilin-type N-terminal cleavage/methylation domain-containing protein
MTNKIMCSHRKDSGFTMVELILVFALIGITASISFSFLKPWLGLYRLKIAARQVAADMQLARLKAVSTNKRYRVEFDVGNNQYDVTKCNDSGCTSTTVEKDNQEFPAGITFGYKTGAQGPPDSPTSDIDDMVTFSSDQGLFKPNGWGSLGYIYIKNENDDTVAVTISETSTGLIRLYHLQPGTTNSWQKVS